MEIRKLLFLFILIVVSAAGRAQDKNLFVPFNIQKAVDKKTRSLDGKPGIKYWQNRADYDMKIYFDPESRLLSGEEKIVYKNNSPDTLKELNFQLYANFYKKGNSRDKELNAEAEDDGVTIDRISVGGKTVSISSENKGLVFEHTSMVLALDNALMNGQQLAIDISWHYTVNNKAHVRTGAVDSTSFFLAYFFPRLCVYDDVDGWNRVKYTGTFNFYNDFGNFNMSVILPRKYICWATGSLENPYEIFAPEYLGRYKSALKNDSVIHIISDADLVENKITLPENFIEWKYKAENVSDLAFALSDHYLWDASSLVVDYKSGRRAMVDAAYNNNTQFFGKIAGIARKSIELASTVMPGVPYPYPKMTVFEGRYSMEYPMMVNLNSYQTYNETLRIADHEVLHSYFPFFMGCNEVKYGWMDEGITNYFDYLNASVIDPIGKGEIIEGGSPYDKRIGTEYDLPIITLSSNIREPNYWGITYYKPAVFLLNLHDYLGDECFKKMLHKFMESWQGKHPTAWDLFFSIQNNTGENLNWLIKPWFFEYGYVDLAINEVKQKKEGYAIVIGKKGNFPSQVDVGITYSNGTSETIHLTAGIWKDGNGSYCLDKQTQKTISKVELKGTYLSDGDLSNNTFFCK